ncbi:MAG: hypothetical protein RLZZ299_2009 [Pseudomonadota bacterium]|jgi:uncharacterized membrane protein YgdD (TMEM256/DUF423 family)
MVRDTPAPGLAFAGVLGAVGVATAAFGTHALRDRIPAARLATWETASRMHLLHAVVLLALALAGDPAPGARRALTVGTLIFAGSLYLLVLLELPVLGAVTPLGGLALITGWSMLAWHGLRRRP